MQRWRHQLKQRFRGHRAHTSVWEAQHERGRSSAESRPPRVPVFHVAAGRRRDAHGCLFERPAGTYEWIPFGGGTRRCLGASFALFEMKIVLGEVLRRFDLQTTTAPGERIARRAITFSPKRGGLIQLARP